jgi:RNA:NAD 2'-phosphotransferase (TPT1/KptA family)
MVYRATRNVASPSLVVYACSGVDSSDGSYTCYHCAMNARELRSGRRQRLARFMSWFLRHGGESVINETGWCTLANLSKQRQVRALGMKMEDLRQEVEEICKEDDKQRFQQNDVGDVRACFGHSLVHVNVWVEVDPKDYPERVAHRSNHWTHILSDGHLRPMSRQMIHLLPLERLADEHSWGRRGKAGVFVLPPGTKLYQSPQGGLLGALDPIPVDSLECALETGVVASSCACNNCTARDI